MRRKERDPFGGIYRENGAIKVLKILENDYSEGDLTGLLAKIRKDGVCIVSSSQYACEVLMRCIHVSFCGDIQFILDSFKNKCFLGAQHEFQHDCLVKLFAFCSFDQTASLIEECLGYARMLMHMEFGHRVICAILNHGSPIDRKELIDLITKCVGKYSKNEYKRKCMHVALCYCTPEDCQKLICAIEEYVAFFNSTISDEFGSDIKESIEHFNKYGQEYINVDFVV